MRKTRTIPERDKKPNFTPQKGIQSNMNEPDLYLHLDSSHLTKSEAYILKDKDCQLN